LFLFFDFSLRTAFDFVEKIQGLSGKGGVAEVFNSRDLSPLGALLPHVDWGESLRTIDRALSNEGEYFSLAIVDAERQWILAQELPVSWGVLAVNGSSSMARKIYDVYSDGDLITLDQIGVALSMREHRFVRDVGEDFLLALLREWGSDQKGID
jgi:hypothetical protein